MNDFTYELPRVVKLVKTEQRDGCQGLVGGRN